jgi:NDP-sugar pyrophosphorylase family protein
MQCVVLAGGLATRMQPLSASVPKALLEVAGRPFAHWQLSWLASQGVNDVVFCIAHLGGQIRSFVGDGSPWGLRARYADEGDELRGTGGALRIALDEGLLESTFFVLYGDSYLDVDLVDVARVHQGAGRPALMTVMANDGGRERSNVRLEHDRVALYDKDILDPEAAAMHHIDYGLGLYTRSIASQRLPPGVSDLAEFQHGLSVDGLLTAYLATRPYEEIGSPEGLASMDARLRREGL